MKLVALLQSATATAFKIAGDLRKTIIIRDPTAVYNAATGKNTKTYADTTLQGLQTAFDLNEIANSRGAIIVTDIKFIIQGSDVKEKINTAWKAILADGRTFSIIPPVKEDAARATVTLQLRSV
jgi:hypothetical protein